MSIRRSGQGPTLKDWIRPYYLKWLYSKLFPTRYPSYFRDCWAYPVAVPSGPSEQSDILFLPAADMHARTQRSEHLATTLAERGFRCFYMNPHLGREFPQPWLRSDRLKVTEIRPRLYEVHVHLPREPVYHHRPLLPSENTLIVDSLSAVFRQFRTDRLVILASFPLWLEVAIAMKRMWGCPVIYDCHDLWAGFGNIDPLIVGDEARFFEISDRILFSAETLRSSATHQNLLLAAKSVIVRNAVAPPWFDMQPARGPQETVTIGYIGSLTSWLDWNTIELAASLHPEWRFVLIGRVESEEAAKLARFENVHLLGEIPYAELARHIAEFHVAMIPFRLTPLTLMTNPIKLYEYFACGLPVVSSALPEVMPFSEMVYIAKDAPDFVTKLEQAISEPDELKALRRATARHETWVDRCRQIEPFLSVSEGHVPQASAHSRDATL
jgi:glycosyltransferase involved in cell wall biosynthesis